MFIFVCFLRILVVTYDYGFHGGVFFDGHSYSVNSFCGGICVVCKKVLWLHKVELLSKQFTRSRG